MKPLSTFFVIMLTASPLFADPKTCDERVDELQHRVQELEGSLNDHLVRYSKATYNKEGETFLVPLEEFEKAKLQEPRILLSQSRIVPYFRNGKVIGVTLIYISDRSVFFELGLHSDDVLLSISKHPFTATEPLALVDALMKAGLTGTGVLELERQGQSLSIKFRIGKKQLENVKQTDLTNAGNSRGVPRSSR